MSYTVTLIYIITLLSFYSICAQPTDEGSEEKASMFLEYFGFHEPGQERQFCAMTYRHRDLSLDFLLAGRKTIADFMIAALNHE